MTANVTISTFQLMELFPDEAAAREYLESRRWPGAGYDPDRKCECASCTLTRTLAAEAQAKRLAHRAAVNQTRLIQQARLDHTRRVAVILADEHALGRAAESLQ